MEEVRVVSVDQIVVWVPLTLYQGTKRVFVLVHLALGTEFEVLYDVSLVLPEDFHDWLLT